MGRNTLGIPENEAIKDTSPDVQPKMLPTQRHWYHSTHRNVGRPGILVLMVVMEVVAVWCVIGFC